MGQLKSRPERAVLGWTPQGQSGKLTKAMKTQRKREAGSRGSTLFIAGNTSALYFFLFMGSKAPRKSENTTDCRGGYLAELLRRHVECPPANLAWLCAHCVAPALASLSLSWRMRIFRLWASAWPSSGCGGHLGGSQWTAQGTCLLSPLQIKVKKI